MSTANWKKPACKRGHVNPPRAPGGACIPCRPLYHAETYERDRAYKIRKAIERANNDPESRRDEQRAHRLGVSVGEVRQAIAACDGKCEACEKPLSHREMCIDHLHGTNTIRGVLCRFCNALEGMLNKQPERVAMVQRYVAREITRREKARAK